LFVARYPQLFPLDAAGNPGGDHIASLLDMFFNPELTPDGPTVRNFGPAPAAGESRYMLNRYLRERGDINIKTVTDLINKSTFYTDIRPDAGFSDRKRALQQIDQEKTFDNGNRIVMRFAIQQVVLQCMGEQKLDALVSPTGNIPTYIIGAPTEPERNGRGISTWGLLGQNGFPSISVPAGFTTHVFDRVRDATAAGGTRLVGPVPAVLPVGVMFVTRPFDEPMLLRISGAYEAATHHRRPPTEFGPLPVRR
jgi:Asp-tRNA(Asn)/Glu-tRNA(Gln) amidotransferase A subunit family amidase